MSVSKLYTDSQSGGRPNFPNNQNDVTEDEYLKYYLVEREDPATLHKSLSITKYDCKLVKCFIFDHKNFDEESPFSTRQGTESDRYGLKYVFKRMNIEPEIYIDLKRSEIFTILEDFVNDENQKCDCLIVVVLTHGDENEGLAAYDESYSLETMYEMFYGDKCRKLVGKPKVFIVNACRGHQTDDGAEEIGTDSVSAKSLPVTSDFLIAQSTFLKFVSWRNELSGSWFIQCLVTVLSENLTNDEKMDLESIMRIVKDRVAINNSDENNDLPKQQPVTISTLRKLLYLPTA